MPTVDADSVEKKQPIHEESIFKFIRVKKVSIGIFAQIDTIVIQ
jgi:hypothetical protein